MADTKLLLVEDDENLAYMEKSCFEDIIGGYEVKTAVNGRRTENHQRSGIQAHRRITASPLSKHRYEALCIISLKMQKQD